MKRSKFTEEQIAFALRQFETGNRVEEVCLQMGISEATFFNWKKKFGSLGVSELRRLRQLEEENSRFKNLWRHGIFEIRHRAALSTHAFALGQHLRSGVCRSRQRLEGYGCRQLR